MIENWQELIETEANKLYYQKLAQFVARERCQYTIYPPMGREFYALSLTPLTNVKVVLVGQDPYHEEGQAQGLAFSVPKGMKIPPSLVNMYKELQVDLGIPSANHGDLTKWAKEGVLLINRVLTVRKGCANSHQNIGWETFTDEVIKVCNAQNHPIVFILLGSKAQTLRSLITNRIHHIIMAPHPSPLSAYQGFFGSRIFSRTNQYLIQDGLQPIDWDLN